ncbi:substrate-binding domain-containing protein [Spongorhabdus nitratireducens]
MSCFIKLLFPLLFLLSAMTLFASPVSSEQKIQAPLIALVLQSMSSDLSRRMERAALQYRNKHPDKFRLQVTGVMNDVEVDQQIKQVDRVVKEKAYGLVIDPVDPRRLVPAIDRAHRKGIRVVVIHNHLDWQAMGKRHLLVPFVGPDNRLAAQQAGLYLAGRLERGDRVAIIKGRPGSAASFERTNGYRQAMHQAGLSIVATISARGQEDQAQRIAMKLLGEFPALRGVMATNDEMAIGVVQALERQKLAGKVAVVGFGASSQIKPFIESGSILATVDPELEQMAVEGIDKLLSGSGGDRALPARLVDRRNYANTPANQDM